MELDDESIQAEKSGRRCFAKESPPGYSGKSWNIQKGY
jgi:hypothetical protein